MATVKSTRFLPVLVLISLLAPATTSAQGLNTVWQEIHTDLMGRPATGYVVDDRAYLNPQNYLVAPGVGWNESKWFPDGRTGWGPAPVRVWHQGQGDAGPFSGWCATDGERNPGAMDWGAEKACFIYNGMVEARVAGSSLAGIELHGHDNGYPGVSGYMAVLQYARDGLEEPGRWRPVTGLMHLGSLGSKPVGSFVTVVGPADVGIDLTGQWGSDASIAIPAGRWVYWDAKPGASPHPSTSWGGVATGFYRMSPEDGAWLTFVKRRPQFQVWENGWSVFDGGLAVTGNLHMPGLPSGSGGRALCQHPGGHIYVAEGDRC